MLVVKSKIKEVANSVNVSGDFAGALDEKLRNYVKRQL